MREGLMPYDEEREEMNRDFHRPTRDLWNPDGMSTVPDCEHPKLTADYLKHIKGLPVCPDCGAVLAAMKSRAKP
jgi:hypothetical protein